MGLIETHGGEDGRLQRRPRVRAPFVMFDGATGTALGAFTEETLNRTGLPSAGDPACRVRT